MVTGLQPDLIVYQFSRPAIERLDFQHFMNLYGAPARHPALRALMNRFVFCVEGFDDDPREIHFIPQIRAFYRKFEDAWPFWFFHCNLDNDTLRSMTLCCLNSLTGISRDGSPFSGVEYDPLELAKFVAGGLPSMNAACLWAGFSEVEIEQRTREVFEYFELPYDAD
jgi:hypothetical protein